VELVSACQKKPTGALDSYFISVFWFSLTTFGDDGEGTCLVFGCCGGSGGSGGGGGCESVFLDNTSFLSSLTDDNPRLSVHISL